MPFAFSSSRKRSRVVAVGEQHREGEVRGALDRLRRRRQLDAGDPREPLAVGANDRAARRDVFVEPPQAAQPERGAGLVEAEVEADVDHVVGGVVAAVAIPGAARHRVRAKQPHALGQLPRQRCVTMPPSPTHSCFLEKKLNAPSSPTVPDLAARRRRRGRRSPARSPRSAPGRARRRALRSASDVGGIAAEVHRHDRARARRDAPRDVLGIDVEVMRAADVAQHRLGADVARRGWRWPRT